MQKKSKLSKDARDYTMADLLEATPAERLEWAAERGRQLGQDAKVERDDFAVRLLKLLGEFESTFDKISATKRAYRELVGSFRNSYLRGYAIYRLRARSIDG